MDNATKINITFTIEQREINIKRFQFQNRIKVSPYIITKLPCVSILYQLSVTKEIDRRKQQGVGNDSESGMFGRSVYTISE